VSPEPWPDVFIWAGCPRRIYPLRHEEGLESTAVRNLEKLVRHRQPHIRQTKFQSRYEPLAEPVDKRLRVRDRAGTRVCLNSFIVPGSIRLTISLSTTHISSVGDQASQLARQSTTTPNRFSSHFILEFNVWTGASS
jgi:hypothetical protein